MSKTEYVRIPMEEFTVLTEPYTRAELKVKCSPHMSMIPVDTHIRVNFNTFMIPSADFEDDTYTSPELVEHQNLLLSRCTVGDEDWLHDIGWEVVGFLSGDLIIHVKGYVDRDDIDELGDLDVGEEGANEN